MPSVFMQNLAEFDAARVMIVDAFTGEDNPLTRYVDRHYDGAAGSDQKRLAYYKLLWSFEEAARTYGAKVGEGDELLENKDEIRAMWREIFEDSCYAADERYGDVFTDGK